jgi:transcription factor HY5
LKNWHLSSRVALLSGGESDEDIGRVPELGSDLAGPSSSGAEVGSAGRLVQAQSSAPGNQRRRGRNPADKEHKRLKRSLENTLCYCTPLRAGNEIVHIFKKKI